MSERSNTNIFKLFDQAMDLEGDAREAFLDEIAGECSETAQKIRKLISEYEDRRSFFEQPLVPKFMNLLVEDKDSAFQGRRLGSYRLTEPLGKGGMGEVWLGVRDDGTHQREVAIKMLTRIHFKDFRRRFENEQQILAGLSHPNIARLYDSGITDDNVPFYVMEYVKGERLDAYANKNKLDLNARLSLFQKVCEAVNFAHQNLIVHRDLKPQNILVTQAGEPMLLDFGIAKVLESDGQMTETGLRPMTREYASPEQIMGKPINISSDIYALGVILYELLTGSRPHRSDSSAPFELERKILEEDPTRPSDMITGGNSGGTTTEITGIIDSKNYQKALSGELDAIILMALQKNPGDRYNSALQFSEDVGAYLKNMPIRARKATTLALTYKFVKRNALPVTFICLVFGGLLVLLAVMDSQKKRAINLQKVSENEKRKAENATRVMLDFFNFSNPYGNPTNEIQISKILDHGQSVIGGLKDQPEAGAILMAAMARLYINMGDLEGAASFMRRGIVNLEQDLGKDHVALAQCWDVLGQAYTQQFKNPLRDEAFTRAFEIRKLAYSIQAPEMAKSLHSMGVVWYDRDPQIAIDYFNQSIDILRESKTDDFVLGWSLTYKGHIKKDQRQYAEAIKYYKEAIAARERSLGADYPLNGFCYYFIGLCSGALGQPRLAEENYLKALDIYSRSVHQDNLLYAAPMRSIVGLYTKHNESDKVAQLRTDQRWKDNLFLYFEIGNHYYLKGEFSTAKTIWLESIEILENRIDFHEGYRYLPYQYLGLLNRAIGDYSAAEHYLGKALSTLPPSYEDRLLKIQDILFLVYLDQGKMNQAEQILCHVMEKRMDDVARKNWALNQSYHYLGRFQARTGLFDEARTQFRWLTGIYKNAPVYRSLLQIHQSENLLNQGDFEGALDLVEAYLPSLDHSFSPTGLYTFSGLANAIEVYIANGKSGKAKTLLEKTQKRMNTAFSDSRPLICLKIDYLDAFYDVRFGSAAVARDKVAYLIQRHHGPDNPVLLDLFLLADHMMSTDVTGAEEREYHRLATKTGREMLGPNSDNYLSGRQKLLTMSLQNIQ